MYFSLTFAIGTKYFANCIQDLPMYSSLARVVFQWATGVYEEYIGIASYALRATNNLSGDRDLTMEISFGLVFQSNLILLFGLRLPKRWIF